MIRDNNIFADVEMPNDIEGLIIPWQLYGELEEQLIQQRYFKLKNNSYGYIVRYPVR